MIVKFIAWLLLILVCFVVTVFTGGAGLLVTGPAFLVGSLMILFAGFRIR